MTEDSITRRLSNTLSTTLRRFVRQVNDDIGTGTEAPIEDAHMRQLRLREQYESECG